MIGIGWTEMLIIAIVLIVVVGPKDLPKMLRAFGRTTANMRRMAGDFQKQFDAALKEAELDDLQNLAKDARKLNPASELKKAVSPFEKAAKDVRSGLDDAAKPNRAGSRQAQADQSQEPASASARAATPVKAGPTTKAGTEDSQSPAKPASTTKPAGENKAKSGSSAKPASAKARATKPAQSGATTKNPSTKSAGRTSGDGARPGSNKPAATKPANAASASKATTSAKSVSGKAGPVAGSKTKGAPTS